MVPYSRISRTTPVGGAKANVTVSAGVGAAGSRTQSQGARRGSRGMGAPDRFCGSTVAPDRRPLGEKGRQPLPHVLGAGQLVEIEALRRGEGGREGQLLAGAHGALGQPRDAGAGGEQRRLELAGARVERGAIGGEGVDEAEPLRLLGAEGAPGEQ